MDATVTMTYAELERTTKKIQGYEEKIQQLEKEAKKVRLEIYVTNDRNRVEATSQYFKRYGNSIPYNMVLEENGQVYINFEDVKAELATRERQNVVNELSRKDSRIYELEISIKNKEEKHTKEIREIYQNHQDKTKELNATIESLKKDLEDAKKQSLIEDYKNKISNLEKKICSYIEEIEQLKIKFANKTIWQCLFS